MSGSQIKIRGARAKSHFKVVNGVEMGGLVGGDTLELMLMVVLIQKNFLIIIRVPMN